MPENNVLTVGSLAPVATDDPAEVRDTISSLYVNQIYEPLMAATAKVGEPPLPLLLARPLEFERPTRCSAVVREGIVFSDGTPLTAELVVASLARVGDFRQRATASVRGDRVVFDLKEPNPAFGLFLTTNFCGIALEKGGRLFGTGAYRGSVLEKGASILRLQRNPSYREKVPIDEVHFVVHPADADGTATKLMNAVRAGEVDFTDSIPAMTAVSMQKEGLPIVAWTTPGNSTGILYFNTERPSLRDARVRKAIAYAIDRHEISRHSFTNFMTFTARDLLPPMMQQGASEAEVIRHDMAQAEKMLLWPDLERPSRLTLLLPWSPRPYMPHPNHAAETITRYVAKLGIAVETVFTASTTEFYDRVDRGDFDLLLLGWIADTPDPADFLESLLSSENIPRRGETSSSSSNRSRWRNAEMDRLLKEFRATPTADVRSNISKLLASEMPLFPLIYGAAVTVLSRRVRNFRPSSLGRVSFGKLAIK
ncbi:MAG TPA: ABC transporter substrate-binding protein [Thermoanaerobaculia bacterium]|nr:ABC transporter substrate-binding protein [Thermoanaerobaculia bacterium]